MKKYSKSGIALTVSFLLSLVLFGLLNWVGRVDSVGVSIVVLGIPLFFSVLLTLYFLVIYIIGKRWN